MQLGRGGELCAVPGEGGVEREGKEPTAARAFIPVPLPPVALLSAARAGFLIERKKKKSVF